MSEPIRVLLVDDDPLVRSGLSLMLGGFSQLEVVGEAEDGDIVVDAVRRHHPDVVLMDLRMPRMDGVSATRAVRALPTPPHVIVLTTWDINDTVVDSIEAGASGFLLKTASPQEIVAALEAVMAGEAVLSPRSTRRLLEQWRRDDSVDLRREARDKLERLTDREREVAVAVAEGLGNAAVGQKLFLSEATVKSHLSAIQTKLGVQNRVMVAVLAERGGLLHG